MTMNRCAAALFLVASAASLPFAGDANASTAGSLFRIEQKLETLHEKIDAQDAALASLGDAVAALAETGDAEIITIPFSDAVSQFPTGEDFYVVPEGKILIVKFIEAFIETGTTSDVGGDGVLADIEVRGEAVLPINPQGFISSIRTGRTLPSRVANLASGGSSLDFSAGQPVYGAFGPGQLRYFVRVSVVGDGSNAVSGGRFSATLHGVLIDEPSE